ncbi:MAG: hypothetical protein WBP08_08060 [Saprospiraceae bacterium]
MTILLAKDKLLFGSDNGVIELKKIKAWLIEFEPYYKISIENKKHCYCPPKLLCINFTRRDECKFYNFYPHFEAIVKLSRYEDYARNELEEYDQIKNYPVAVKEWAVRNFKMNSEIAAQLYFDYKADDYKIKHIEIFQPVYAEMKFFAHRKDFESIIAYLRLYDDLYYKQKVFPERLDEEIFNIAIHRFETRYIFPTLDLVEDALSKMDIAALANLLDGDGDFSGMSKPVFLEKANLLFEKFKSNGDLELEVYEGYIPKQRTSGRLCVAKNSKQYFVIIHKLLQFDQISNFTLIDVKLKLVNGGENVYDGLMYIEI